MAKSPDNQTDRYEELANLIRLFRFSADWTQAELAAKAGIALISVSAVENGHNPRWETLTCLARAFGYDTFIDLCRSENNPSHNEQTQTLLRAWNALPNDQARKEVLALIAAEIVKPRTPQNVSDGTAESPFRRRLHAAAV
jgi:transcriptional regulator with XRE-family HTH domain